MSVREMAKALGFEIVGKLRRIRPVEYFDADGNLHKDPCYIDEAGNEYWPTADGVCIVTADGGVI